MKKKIKKHLSTGVNRFRSEWKSSAADPAKRLLYKRGILTVAGLALFLIGFGLIKGVLVWREVKSREADLKAGPGVRTAIVGKSPEVEEITVTGETRPFASVTLFAKVSGYLSDVKVDKGDVVKRHQVIAIINSPETSEAYQAALADALNKRGIAGRMRALLNQKLVSDQEAEQAFSDKDVAEARLESMAAIKGYEILRAPFDGTVTARFVDPGNLVQNATSAQTGAQPVVTVSQLDKLRIYAYIDQKHAYFVRKEDPVKITVSERPELKMVVAITRLAGELDARTRMMLAEIQVDNTKGELVPGSLVDVTVKMRRPSQVQVPVEALLVRDDKTMVPVVGDDGVLHYREVEAGDNDGKFVRILSGLKENEKVALDVGNNVNEGGHVRMIAAEPDSKKK